MLQISLFHVGSGLKTEVTMGDLISDQIKSPFYMINTHINLHTPANWCHKVPKIKLVIELIIS